ncbi:MAG TPA: hypothetical protein VER96_39220 [Polyangiaceae bacterium]|nr:hypothetical protein [Polyangiaceae bacterium]
MGATRRSCGRAVVLAALMSAVVGAMLPGCAFPDYGMASTGGTAGVLASGGSSSGEEAAGMAGAAGAAGDGGDGGSEAEGGAGAGAGTGGAPGGTGGMIIEPPRCDQTCVPRTPLWQGPVAYWEGPGGSAVPACPEGFDDPLPSDVHRGLIAPDPTCTCTCDPAENQVCDTTLHMFTGQNCDNHCADQGIQSCTSVPPTCSGSQGSANIDVVTISGGACKARIAQPVGLTWQYDGRICKKSDVGTCDDPNQVCTRLPEKPYRSPLCVTRLIPEGQDLPQCPAGYPHPVEPLYAAATDQRGCTACTCGNPSGGTCAGSINISSGNDCSAAQGEYIVGMGKPLCQRFNMGDGPVRPTRVIGDLSASQPGACSVAIKSQSTMGKAFPSGEVSVVCCQ